MRYEDNPADERYQLDQCIDEIKSLRDQLAKSDAAIADAAEQLRAVMEANEKLRKQLSDQASEISMLNAEAEMWQQRAEMAEREVVRVNERLAAAERLIERAENSIHWFISETPVSVAGKGCIHTGRDILAAIRSWLPREGE